MRINTYQPSSALTAACAPIPVARGGALGAFGWMPGGSTPGGSMLSGKGRLGTAISAHAMTVGDLAAGRTPAVGATTLPTAVEQPVAKPVTKPENSVPTTQVVTADVRGVPPRGRPV